MHALVWALPQEAARRACQKAVCLLDSPLLTVRALQASQGLITDTVTPLAHRYSMLRMSLAPCAPFTVDNELMIEAAKMARKHPGVRLHTHLAENQEDVDYSLKVYGCRPGEYLTCASQPDEACYHVMLSFGWFKHRSTVASANSWPPHAAALPRPGLWFGHVILGLLSLVCRLQEGGLGQGRLLVRTLLHAGQGGAEAVC